MRVETAGHQIGTDKVKAYRENVHKILTASLVDWVNDKQKT